MQADARQVPWDVGDSFARQHGCLFVETSAKHNVAVALAFEELVLKILDTPGLLARESDAEMMHLGDKAPTSSACAC